VAAIRTNNSAPRALPSASIDAALALDRIRPFRARAMAGDAVEQGLRPLFRP